MMRRIHSSLPLFLASICLVFFIVTSVYAQETEAVELRQEALGKAPSIRYQDAGGLQKTLDVTKHKLTVLHFWATWCVPCVDELPQVDDTQEIFGKELQIVPIALDGTNSAKVKKFMADHKIDHLPVLLDPTNKTAQTAGLKGLPGSVFIDSKNNIVARADGPLDWEREDVVGFLKRRLK